MADRSQTKRLLSTLSAALRCAALLLLLVAGCQSNVQHDLVAREMRMQEDQLYAMEDYLAQYQQLLCKYRAENATLRRRLTGGSDDGAETPAPRTTPRTRNGPSIETTPTPRTNGTQPPLDLPDIPPLKETTSNDADTDFQSGEFGGKVALAAGESTTGATSVASAIAFEPMPKQDLVQDVWLHGEVVENDAGGGPRLVVEIEPLDDMGRATNFDGALSLMLLAPTDGGDQESLARWDFAPKDVKAAIDPAIGDGTIRFHIELPEDAAVAESPQLWLRLLSRRGEKLLTHAAIDLQRPGEFTSRTDGDESTRIVAENPAELPGEQAVLAAVYSDPSDRPPAESSDLYDGGWSIARPGEPANLPNAAAESDNDWRASLEPPPVAIATSVPAPPTPRVSRPTTPLKTAKAPTARLRRPAGWSPDRPANSSASAPRTAARPRWSATR